MWLRVNEHGGLVGGVAQKVGHSGIVQGKIEEREARLFNLLNCLFSLINIFINF